MNDLSAYWRKCGTCKKPIPFGSIYWGCSVSTCNKKKSPAAFCSISCWDAHLPVMNHRDAWSTEQRAPKS